MQRARQKHVDELPIRIEDDKLIIDHFESDSEDVVRYFEDVEEEALLERFGQALAVGTIALRTMRSYENIDLIERKFNRMQSSFESRLKETLTEITKEVDDKFGKKGDVTLFVDKHFGEKGEVPTLVEAYFGKDGQLSRLMEDRFGVKGSFSETVDKYFGEKGLFQEQVEKILGDKGSLKALLDPGQEGTPFNLLIEDIKAENAELIKKIVAEKVREEFTAKTTLKGFEFEEWVYTTLCEIARSSNLGDVIEDVSKETSESLLASKKGDFVLTLGENPNLRIAVDAKNYSTKLTFPKIKETLERAMKARNAQYGMLVSKQRDALPAFVGYFSEYDNMLICALGKNDDPTLNYEIMEIAYKWAKLQVLRKNRESGKVDVSVVSRELNAVKDELKDFQKILSQCENIDTSSTAIRETCKTMKSKVSSRIDDLLGKLSM
jgi:hypothetical protein